MWFLEVGTPPIGQVGLGLERIRRSATVGQLTKRASANISLLQFSRFKMMLVSYAVLINTTEIRTGLMQLIILLSRTSSE